MSKIPSTRKTVTHSDVVWAAVERYKEREFIPTMTDAHDQLVRDGLRVNCVDLAPPFPAKKKKAV